jgi:hypothetical protein
MEKNRNPATLLELGGLKPAELYALERNARRERAEAVGRMVVEGTGRLAAALARTGSAIAGALRGEVGHAQ